MRYPSMKSIVAALSISVTLLAAVPTASARPVQSARNPQTARTRDDRPSSDRIAAVREFINRALRRIATQGGITIPIPRTEPSNPE